MSLTTETVKATSSQNSTMESVSSSPPPTKKKAKTKTKTKKNKNNKNGDVKLKILPDGTTKVSVPKRKKSAAAAGDEERDEVVPLVSTARSFSPTRMSKKKNKDGDGAVRSKSAEGLTEMASSSAAASSSKKKKKSGTKTKKKVAASDGANGKAVASASPVRFGARKNSSASTRSVSADYLREMQQASEKSLKEAAHATVRSNSDELAGMSSAAASSTSKKKKIDDGKTKRRSSIAAAPVRFGARSKSSAGVRSASADQLREMQASAAAKPAAKPQGILRNSTHHKKLNRINELVAKSAPAKNSNIITASPCSSTASSHHTVDFTGKVEGFCASKSGKREKKLPSLPTSSHHSVSFDVEMIALSDGDLELDEHDYDVDSFASDLVEEVPINFDDADDKRSKMKAAGSERAANKARPGLKRLTSQGSFLGFSTHSYLTNRSQMAIDVKEGFDDDPKWKEFLRYMRLLPPHKAETDLKRKIRMYTWIAMFLDFIAAMVAVTTYRGSTTCCGEPIFDILMDINWDILFRAVTIIYLLLIFAEIVPVIRKGMPFNIINPTIGFIITFGMFFDDSVGEAVAMWVIEAMAIFFEFLVYRTNARIFRETSERLDQIEVDLENVKKSRRQILESSIHLSRHSNHGSRQFSTMDLEMNGEKSQRSHSNTQHAHENNNDTDIDQSMSGHSFSDDHSNDDESFSGDSFGEEKNPPSKVIGMAPSVPSLRRMKSSISRSQLSTARSTRSGLSRTMSMASGRTFIPGERKQNRLLRERRMIREKRKADEKDLHYHFVGTILNVSLAALAMSLIIGIASTGGLCFNDDDVKIFSMNQLGKCNKCIGPDNPNWPEDGYCESCDGARQCYYPYY